MPIQPDNEQVVMLDLDRFADGFPHMPAARAALLAQAAVVCLDHEGHSSGAELGVEGIFAATFALTWSEEIAESTRRFWNDFQEATEHGAYALAILLMRSLTNYTVIERSR